MSTRTEIRLTLPRPHSGQVPILRSRARYKVVACGRRFGKTIVGEDRVSRPAIAGFPVGWFAPEYKYLAEPWDHLSRRLAPLIASSNKTERRIDLVTGGRVDFLSMDDPDAGRGRKYKHVVVDEAAKARHLEAAWTKAIRPTLTDYKGTADFYSTPRGRDFFWRLFTRGEDPEQPEYESWQLPTVANPFIDPDEVEAARRELPERVFQQEYLAEFLEDAGGVFRNVSGCVDRGRVEPDERTRGRAYAMGVDLARTEDFTVIAILDDTGRQAYFERLPHVDWARQMESIKRAADAYDADVIVDATGVGSPIFEQLYSMGVRVQPFVFTAASKPSLIDDLSMALEGGKVRLMDVPEQENELIAYEYQMTSGRNWRTSAPQGMHDDCVAALALAYRGCQSATSNLPRIPGRRL